MLGDQRSLLDQITVHHGPQKLLARFFLIADQDARDKGVTLRLRTDFDRMHQIRLRHCEDPLMLAPNFDPAQSNLRIDQAFWIEGLDPNGQTVLTHAARLFDWQHTNLKQEVEALRVHYHEPAPHIAAGESIQMTAPTGTRISRRTAYVGAMWVRPDYRRRGLTRIIPRISRAYAYTRWNTDFTWGFMEPHLHEGGASRAYGRYTVEEGLRLNLAMHQPFDAMLL